MSNRKACLAAPGSIPFHPRGRCEAMVRIFIGQKTATGSWVPCRKDARKGKRTCWWHRHLEQSA